MRAKKKREPITAEVTGVISLFDFGDINSNYGIWKEWGPACMTIDQIADARKAAAHDANDLRGDAAEQAYRDFVRLDVRYHDVLKQMGFKRARSRR